MDILEIKQLSFTYPNRDKSALDRVSLRVEPGEFVTLCGASGCGKTTLLRHLKPGSAPYGLRTGQILWNGKPIETLSDRAAATEIGYVMQSPDNQMITDKVWHELAFGPESLGLPTSEIRLRVAETASYFGIQNWFHHPVAQLSGGQKQLLALASIMVLHPKLLLLDEPTSHLDPIAAVEFLETLGRLNRDLGVTVLLSEHRTQETFPLSGRVLVLEEGRLIANGTPRQTAKQLRAQDCRLFFAMPTAARIWAASDRVGEEEVPITVAEGAAWLSRRQVDGNAIPLEEDLPETPVALALREVWFRYGQEHPFVVRGLEFDVRFGRITAILGGNGTGKSTALSLMAGVHRPTRGRVTAAGSVALLPQDPQMLFTAKTLREDLLVSLPANAPNSQQLLAETAALCQLEGLLNNHPYDLSGGEQQRAALAKVLMLQPDILLLDEPTRGLDVLFKQQLADILRHLAARGNAVVLVSHDTDFCAMYADRCTLFFDGSTVTANSPRAFFAGNSYYTTAANRIARNMLPRAVTVDDILLALGEQPRQPPPLPIVPPSPIGAVANTTPPNPPTSSPIPLARRLVVGLSALFLFVSLALGIRHHRGLLAFLSGGSTAVTAATHGTPLYLGIVLAFSLGVMGVVSALARAGVPTVRQPGLSPRVRAVAAAVAAAVPLTILLGVRLFEGRRYYLISLLVMLETALPFAVTFEARRAHVRKLVLMAVLCSLAVTGRAAFFMLPQFKPMTALVIVSGVALGGEAGFLVGAMTAFVSNLFFGQGPWTPWQIFALGLIGLLAGILYGSGLLRRTTPSLAAFGALSALLLYGGIMNVATLLITQSRPTWPMLLAFCLQGLPFDLVHAAATVIFLSLLAQPMLEKLERAKLKYGLITGDCNGAP